MPSAKDVARRKRVAEKRRKKPKRPKRVVRFRAPRRTLQNLCAGEVTEEKAPEPMTVEQVPEKVKERAVKKLVAARGKGIQTLELKLYLGKLASDEWQHLQRDRAVGFGPQDLAREIAIHGAVLYGSNLEDLEPKEPEV